MSFNMSFFSFVKVYFPGVFAIKLIFEVMEKMYFEDDVYLGKK